MARSFGRRFMDFLWGPAEEDYVYTTRSHDGLEAEDEFGLPEQPAAPRAQRREATSARGDRTEEVLELRPPRQPRVELCYPRTFEDARGLADLFKQGACLVVNLSEAEEKDRARIINFLCGVAYGRDGRSERSNDLTFVFAPRHFELESDQPRRGGSLSQELGPMPRFAMPS